MYKIQYRAAWWLVDVGKGGWYDIDIRTSADYKEGKILAKKINFNPEIEKQLTVKAKIDPNLREFQSRKEAKEWLEKFISVVKEEDDRMWKKYKKFENRYSRGLFYVYPISNKGYRIVKIKTKKRKNIEFLVLMTGVVVAVIIIKVYHKWILFQINEIFPLIKKGIKFILIIFIWPIIKLFNLHDGFKNNNDNDTLH